VFRHIDFYERIERYFMAKMKIYVFLGRNRYTVNSYKATSTMDPCGSARESQPLTAFRSIYESEFGIQFVYVIDMVGRC